MDEPLKVTEELDVSEAVDNEEPMEENIDEEMGGDEEEIALSDVEQQCMHEHYRACYFFGEHPLIMDRKYFDFRKTYIDMIETETLAVAIEEADREMDDPSYIEGRNTYNVNGTVSLKTDPRENPKFQSDLKMCVRLWNDTSNIKTDRLPTAMSDLIYCDIDAVCCGANLNWEVTDTWDVIGYQTGDAEVESLCCNVY